MTGFPDHLLGDTAEIGLLLVLGAGAGDVFDSAAASRARFLVLVEADPDRAGRLTARAETVPGARVVAAAIGPAEGTAEFRRFNLASQSSLREPTDILTLYPGLRQTERVDVPVTDMSALLDSLPPAEGRQDVLLVDAPGEEETAITGLLGHAAAARFGTVLLACGTTPHYAGSAPIGDLEQRLLAAGYRCDAEDASDPDRPLRLYRPDPLQGENRRLTEVLAEAQAQAAAERQRAEEAIAEVATMTARAEAAEAALATARSEIAALGDLGARLAAAEQLAGEQATRLAEAEAQLASERERAEAEAARAEAAENAARAAEHLSGEQTAKLSDAEARLASGKKRAETEAARANKAEEAARAAERRTERLAAEQATKLAEIRAQLTAETARAEAAELLAGECAARLAEAEGQLTAGQKRAEEAEAQATAHLGKVREIETRLRLARDDLRRTEGQIGLLTDLLLRGDVL